VIDPECCDGTDEPEGVCEDVCAAVGEEFRAGLEEERKKRKTVRSLLPFFRARLAKLPE